MDNAEDVGGRDIQVSVDRAGLGQEGHGMGNVEELGQLVEVGRSEEQFTSV